MEALILIFGELIFTAVMPLLAALASLVGTVLSAVIEFVLALIPMWRRDAGHRASPSSAAPAAPRRRLGRRLGMAFAAVFALTVLAVGIANFFFFETSVNYVLGVVERKSGIATACERIDGNLFGGALSLEDCTIARPSGQRTAMNLSLERLDLALRPLSILGTAHFDSVDLQGLRGSVRRALAAADGGDTTGKAAKPRRPFEVAQLDLRDVQLTISAFNRDGEPFDLAIEIDTLKSAPLRGRKALFDLLFRSSGRGRIAGGEFEFASAVEGAGRRTTWRAQAVPVAQLGAVVGGSLAWLHDGTVDIHVEDQWAREDALQVDMDWQLDFSGVRVAPPANVGFVTDLLTRPLVKYVNRHDGDFPLHFKMVLDENRFDYASSLAATGLWSVVGETVDDLWSKIGAPGYAKEEHETGEALKEVTKQLLDRLRKPKPETPTEP